MICPTALWIILIWIDSWDNFNNESESASIEPSTSPFTITFNSWKSPKAILLPISSNVICLVVLRPCSLWSCCLLEAICFISFSSSSTLNTSPALAAPFIPRTETGLDGPADSTGFPLSSCMAFILPNSLPAIKVSPTFIVPYWTRSVVT